MFAGVIHDFPKVFLALSTGQPANGKARDSSLSFRRRRRVVAFGPVGMMDAPLVSVFETRQAQLPETAPGDIQVSLHDGKQVLAVGCPVSSDASIVPPQCPKGGNTKPPLVDGHGGYDIVQLHHDIGTDVVLTPNRIFGSQHHVFSCVR
jgi:hypothetical protein